MKKRERKWKKEKKFGQMYFKLRELMPQDDSSWEEAVFDVLIWWKREWWPLVMLV